MNKIDLGILLIIIAGFNFDKPIGGFLIFIGLWLIFIED